MIIPKTITLKEVQTTYSLPIEASQLNQGPPSLWNTKAGWWLSS